jgi:DNA polymerase-4
LSLAERPRAIIHLDLDAFFAAVEMLENAELQGRPLIVGGRADARGVVASASYEARAFGIRSAMATSRALALCPEAVVVPARHRLYQTYSRRVMNILRQASSLVQQTSIDEAFLDVSDQIERWESAVEIARELQQGVRDQVGLSASLGVAANKLVAKVASDRDKPGGLTVVQPGQEAAFLAPLPVRVLWGVGPVTARRLGDMGVSTVGDLARIADEHLQARFGQQGRAMVRQAQGIDPHPVVTDRQTKSVSQERTFSRDLGDAEALEHELRQLCQGVAQRLKRAELTAGTVAIKLRYADFATLTRQMSLAVPTDGEEMIRSAALTLLQRAWKPGRPVRLLGVACRHLSPPAGQLPLF